MNNQANEMYEHIPAEMFELAQPDAKIHDTRLSTKSRGYFADALIRFKKNKSSVAAAWIIGFLILFSIVAPILSPYNIKTDKESIYKNYPPYVESVANMNIGILDGGKTISSANELTMLKYKGIAQETGMDPVLGIDKTIKVTEKVRGQEVEKEFYQLSVNAYYEKGIVFRVVDYATFEKIQQFQDETGIQVLYPAVQKTDIYVDMTPEDANRQEDVSNIWYQCSDAKGTPILDDKGNFIPAYCTDASAAGPVEYHSQRIAGDDGSYVYSISKSGAVSVRICYYNFYQYMQWAETGEYHAPMYLFGTTSYGQDMFAAIGMGARFSLIFALVVSAINLTIGAVYGSIQGYYGGNLDIILDRISDILSGVPFIVVATLFKLHLAAKVGMVPSFLFAFILTGWIGMAALTRKQFYRFKSQEHILAARTLGASDRRLMFKHIFPNALGTIVTSCALVIPGVIGSETNLTYLGIIDLSSVVGTSIGVLMQQGQLAMTAAPHAMFFPALFFSLLMISFNLFGNGLRDAFNPTTRGAEG